MVLRFNSFLLLFAALLVVGCDNTRDLSEEALDQMAGPEGRQETVAVSGKVTIDGSPAAHVNIYAYTQSSGMEPAQRTRTKADGTYCWTKYKMCDGLVPGTYKLGFAHIPKEGKTKEEGEDMFGGKYKNPMKHDFELVVASGQEQVDVNYDLTTD